MKKLKNSIYSLSILAFVFLGYTMFQSGDDSVPPDENQNSIQNLTRVSVSTVKNSDFSRTTEINGRVTAKTKTHLFSEIQGKIIKDRFEFREGNSFAQNEALVRIESTQFQFELIAQKKSLLRQIVGLLPDIELDFPNSYTNWNEYVTTFDAEKPLTAIPHPKSDKEKLFLNSRGIFALYYQVKAQEEHLKKFTILAPYDGVVTEDLIEIGTLVNPGQALGTIIEKNNYELEAGVPLRYLEFLEINDEVSFRSNDLPATWIGTVKRVGSTINPQTQLVSVFFDLEGENLREGLYLEGEFIVSELSNVTKIPNQAFQRDQSVLVVKDQFVIEKTVQPLEFSTDSIVVSGLNNGELVITTLPTEPIIGQKVEVIKQ